MRVPETDRAAGALEVVSGVSALFAGSLVQAAAINAIETTQRCARTHDGNTAIILPRPRVGRATNASPPTMRSEQTPEISA
jgi:hypothetical protein